MNSKKSTRTRFTIAVLDHINDGKAITEICREFSLASSTLFQFIKDEKKIRDEFENKAQQANDASMGILSTFSTLSTSSTPSTFSNVNLEIPDNYHKENRSFSALKKQVTDGLTEGQTTDGHDLIYRDARTHLKVYF